MQLVNNSVVDKIETIHFPEIAQLNDKKYNKKCQTLWSACIKTENKIERFET